MELTELIDSYAKAKSLADQAKKDADKLNLKIKKKLSEEGVDIYSSDEYTVVRTEICGDKLNEDKLIETIRAEYPDLADDLILMIPKIDVDKMEDLVYNRVIPADVISRCMEKKAPTVRLNIKKKKEDE